MTTATRVLMPGQSVCVDSRSVAGVSYTVALALDGRLLCNCPASYNHLECWHIKHVREEMMTTETAVAIRPVIPAQTAALVPSRADMDLIKDAAKMVFDGRIALPKEIDTPAKAAAIMLYGLELGLRPMTAIRNLYIVNGRVEPSAKLMAGMLMRSDSRARLVVLDCKVERDDKNNILDRSFCKLRIVRPSRDIDQVWTVDWGQIRRAGLARDNNLLYPEDRLFYHCAKRLMRMYAPDVIEGLDDNAPTLSSLMPREAAPALPSPEEAGLYNDGDEPSDAEYRDVDTETGEIFDEHPDEGPVMNIDEVKAAISRIMADLKSSWPPADYGKLFRELTADYPDFKNGVPAGMDEESSRALLARLYTKQ